MPGDAEKKIPLAPVLKALGESDGKDAPKPALVEGVFAVLDRAAAFRLPEDASPRDASLVSRLDGLYGALRRVRLRLIRRESEAKTALRKTTAEYERRARALRLDDDVVRAGGNKEEREALVVVKLEKEGLLTKLADAEDCAEAWGVLREGGKKAAARLEFARKALGLLAGRESMG